MCFDILNRLGKDHECDGRTDGRAAVNNSADYRPALKCKLIGCTKSNRIEFDTELNRIKSSFSSLANRPSLINTLCHYTVCLQVGI